MKSHDKLRRTKVARQKADAGRETSSTVMPAGHETAAVDVKKTTRLGKAGKALGLVCLGWMHWLGLIACVMWWVVAGAPERADQIWLSMLVFGPAWMLAFVFMAAATWLRINGKRKEARVHGGWYVGSWTGVLMPAVLWAVAGT